MGELARRKPVEVSVAAAPDFNARIASLRAAGAGQLDPVRLHYIEALARRTLAHEGNVRYLLDAKLSSALSAFQERLVLAEVKGVQQATVSVATDEQCTPLGMLVRQLGQQLPAPVTGLRKPPAAPSQELKTLRGARNIWSTLSVEKQVAKELAQAPKNAGPINSHMLILRSLTLMHTISPQYLNSFMAYAETLLCLDQCDNEKSGTVKKQRAVKTVKSKSVS